MPSLDFKTVAFSQLCHPSGTTALRLTTCGVPSRDPHDAVHAVRPTAEGSLGPSGSL
jgi:hypothetical protein